MSLIPTPSENLARARSDLRLGLPIVLVGHAGTMLCIAVEELCSARLTALQAAGSPELVLTARRAETLKTPAYDGDIARIAVPPDAEVRWLRALADPADDLRVPMKGPLHPMRNGSADLHRLGIALAKTAELLPAVLMVPIRFDPTMPEYQGLTVLQHAACADLGRISPLFPVVSARLPMAAAEAGRLHIFRPDDGGAEHYAIEIGKPDRSKPVLARLHSACFTGDVLGSLKCDCGPQLRAALAQMGAEGSGVLLYLNQEGRGIGLANKMRAYSLQDQGFDTVEANHRLGFEDDERDFSVGANILQRMGFSSVRLMTNNPKKLAMLQGCGLTVTERVPLLVGQTTQNQSYLATKAIKSGHLL